MATGVVDLQSRREADDTDFAIRTAFWAQRRGEKKDRRLKRQRPREPLVLAGHGVSLRIPDA